MFERSGLLGGRDEPVPLSNISVSSRELQYVNSALNAGWISGTGPYIDQFEESLSKQLEVPYVIVVSSGTSALELALRAIDVGPGDEVILPALTFAAPASAILAVGATPVFSDVSPVSWTLDPNIVSKLVSSRTKAIIAVDVCGHACDYDQLRSLGYPIIEDAAEAYGAMYRGKPAGSLGTVAALSFHANKVVSTGEGGCVATTDKSIAERIRTLNNHGMRAGRPYWHVYAGHNRRMTSLSAAFGLAQVERSAELIGGRRRVAERYDAGLRDLPVRRRPMEPWAQESVWLYTILSGGRDKIIEECSNRRIDARRIWPVVPDVPAFSNPKFLRTPIPVARAISAEALWLPTWSSMPSELVDRVVDAVRAGLR